jgi:histidinol phosphatase-like PHP family hydrolase
MKMKEKKTEEVIEEVVENSKISDELREYLEFVRFCVHQVGEFDEFHKSCTEGQDMLLEHLGLDISKLLDGMLFKEEY